MNKSMLAGIGIGVAAALGVAAVASLNVLDRGPQYAQVVSATPIKETVKTPRQECRNVSVTHRRPVQDENRIAGSVLGAVAGGVIGHQFGGGRGKDVATVVGALGGGYAGNQVQGAMQDNDTYTTTQQRCKTVYDKSEKMLGYDVTYKIGDQQGKIRMDKDPGTQIPLDGNGQLVLNNKVYKRCSLNLAPHALRLRSFFLLQILSSSGHSRSVVSLIFCSFSSVAPSRALIDIPCKIQLRYCAST